jgi:hypothetical protein
MIAIDSKPFEARLSSFRELLSKSHNLFFLLHAWYLAEFLWNVSSSFNMRYSPAISNKAGPFGQLLSALPGQVCCHVACAS